MERNAMIPIFDGSPEHGAPRPRKTGVFGKKFKSKKCCQCCQQKPDTGPIT